MGKKIDPKRINPEKTSDRKKGYDLRQRLGEEPDNLFYQLGYNLGARMRKEGKLRIVIGGDSRVTTPELKEQFYQGLMEHDLNIIDLGENLPTPLIYAAAEFFDASAVTAVTASHSSWDWNGVKINIFERDRNKISKASKAKEKLSKEKLRRELRTAYGIDIKSYYQAFLKDAFSGMEKLCLAVDPLHGSYSGYAPEVLSSLGHVVRSDCYLHNVIKGFPDNLDWRSSDPHKDKNLEHLVETIKHSQNGIGGYNYGVAFDGDGDRVRFVDNRGKIVSEDEITVLISKYLLDEYYTHYCHEYNIDWDNFKRSSIPEKEKPKIIVEIKSSKMVEDEVQKAGGQVVREQTGRINIKERMSQDSQIIFGGELSGHYFYRENFCGRPFYCVDTGEDGLFTALLLGKVLQVQDKKLSKARTELATYCTSGEIRLNYRENETREAVVDEIKNIINHLKASYYQDDKAYQVLEIGDDVRVESTGSEKDYCSVVFRNSKNDPQKFTFVFEGKEDHSLKDIEHNFLERIRKGKYSRLYQNLTEVLHEKKLF